MGIAPQLELPPEKTRLAVFGRFARERYQRKGASGAPPNHEWLLRVLERRVGDPRITSLIRRWLKAGILEEGKITPNEAGSPQGSSISVLLSNLYLHEVLDLWFEQVVKPRLRGEAYLIRYIDDFVMCFQYREDADRVLSVLGKRAQQIRALP